MLLAPPSPGNPLPGKSCSPKLQFPHPSSFSSVSWVSHHWTTWTGHSIPRIIYLFNVWQSVVNKPLLQNHPEHALGWNVRVWILWNALKMIFILYRIQILLGFLLSQLFLLSQPVFWFFFICWLLSHCKYSVKTQDSILGVPLLSIYIRFPALSWF